MENLLKKGIYPGYHAITFNCENKLLNDIQLYKDHDIVLVNLNGNDFQDSILDCFDEKLHKIIIARDFVLDFIMREIYRSLNKDTKEIDSRLISFYNCDIETIKKTTQIVFFLLILKIYLCKII